jgi:hypothetical protein
MTNNDEVAYTVLVQVASTDLPHNQGFEHEG